MNEEWVSWTDTTVCRVQYAYTAAAAAAVVVNFQLVLCVMFGCWRVRALANPASTCSRDRLPP